MLSYPFDPQCRLSSNWIPGEVVTAFISAKTRTIVPVHAPFFQNAVITKDGIELIEGIDFYFSLKHKVASEATCQGIYGGITLINDDIQLPVTIDYHPQGGSYEATYGQIYNYLETDPDIWDGSWESLINDSYYPPVNVLYNPELYVSEPAIIEACQLLTTTINSKDEQESLDFNLLKTRIASLTKDIKRLQVEEHTSVTGNVHGTQPWHINAMSVSEPATNAAKLQGKSYTEFMDYVASRLVKLDTLITDLYRVNTEITTDTLLVNSGTLLLGDTTALLLTPESIAQYDDGAVILHADKECNSVGTTASLTSGVNKLEVVSSGNSTNNRSLLVNGEEVITTESLRAFTLGILYPGNTGLVTQPTDTLQWTGDGSMEAPLEAIPKLPVATESGLGIVKVVNEGSHGYPCPGYGGQNFYAWYTGNGTYSVLRNGADDLEHDVFVDSLTETPFNFSPSANRFRPDKLPVTAIPTYVRHGTKDCVWLDTTDGPFILLTDGNADFNTWRCLKITNADFNHGYYGCPFRVGNKLYAVLSRMLGTGATVQYWEATITIANTITFIQRTLNGNNCNSTYQNGQVFNIFDKMIGVPGEKAYVVDGDGYYTHISVSHAGDQFDHVQKGKQVRICHNGWMWVANTVAWDTGWHSVSYVLDLETGAFVPDRTAFPLTVTRNGISDPNPRPPLACSGGNYTINAVRANGKVLAFMSYYRYCSPRLLVLSNNIDEFENVRWNQQQYTNVGNFVFLGAYAGPVHSGIRGVFPLSGNRLMGVCLDGVRTRFRYDPYGSYAPGAKGYGPTNDRIQFYDSVVHNSLSRMTWYFDGDIIRQNGTVLRDENLSNSTTYDNDIFGVPVSISAATLNTIKQQAILKYAGAFAPTIVETRLTLGIHRVPGVRMLGMLQVMWRVPTDTNGRKQHEVIVFEITPNTTAGVITSVGLGTQRFAWTQIDTATNFVNSEPIYVSNSGVYRLKDGGHAVMLGGSYAGWVGNSGSPSIVAVYDANGNYVGQTTTSVNTVEGVAWLGTKELGFGYLTISGSGEGLYLNSYGNTTAELIACFAGQRQTEQYIIVLSRSDAGDNVAISQAAATEVRAKILSLIPPSRKVQGMDLSQDRVITREQIPNASNVPNVKDVDYPVLGKHTVTLVDKALASHQHPQDDYIVTVASVDTPGYSVLGGPNSAPSAAVGPAMLNQLDINAAVLNSRPVSVKVLDSAITIDSTL